MEGTDMSTRRLPVACLLVTSAVLLLGCGTGDPEGVDGGANPSTEPSDNGSDEVGGGDEQRGDEDDAEVGDEQGRDGTTAGGAEASDSREVTLAIADAAQRTSLDEGDIELVELSMVTWPDGALGCPEPDTMYTQALVDGYRIVLDADGSQLVYHGAVGEDPFLCEDPQAPLEAEQD